MDPNDPGRLVTVGELEAMGYGDRGIMQRAIFAGILKPGVHFLKTPGGRRKYRLWLIKKVLPEIRACFPTNTNRLRVLEHKKRTLVISTERRTELLRLISEHQLAESQLFEQLDKIQRAIRNLQREYFRTLYEQSTCPHCNGTGKSGSQDCLFCLRKDVDYDVTRTKKLVGNVVDTDFSTSPITEAPAWASTIQTQQH